MHPLLSNQFMNKTLYNAAEMLTSTGSIVLDFPVAINGSLDSDKILSEAQKKFLAKSKEEWENFLKLENIQWNSGVDYTTNIRLLFQKIGFNVLGCKKSELEHDKHHGIDYATMILQKRYNNPLPLFLNQYAKSTQYSLDDYKFHVCGIRENNDIVSVSEYIKRTKRD